MTGGFALVAYPVRYRDSGVMTFVVNQDGQIYQKDLGSRTEQIASEMVEYNPDNTWQPVGETEKTNISELRAPTTIRKVFLRPPYVIATWVPVEEQQIDYRFERFRSTTAQASARRALRPGSGFHQMFIQKRRDFRIGIHSICQLSQPMSFVEVN